MIRLSKQFAEENIYNFIRDWIELLSQEKYEEALQQLWQSPNKEWTPDLLRTVIENYGSVECRKDGAKFQLTSLRENNIGDPSFEVEWLADNSNRLSERIGYCIFALPLNGEYSDVSTIFNIVDLGTELTLELDEIHVL